jgi:hypothetical protein
MNENGRFKICPNCGHVWENREKFLKDDDVTLVGYQVQFKVLTAGMFLFNHSCRGTMALEVSAFEDLYDGPIFQDRATGTGDCPGYCLERHILDPCPAKCECAFVREIIQLLVK